MEVVKELRHRPGESLAVYAEGGEDVATETEWASPINLLSAESVA